MLAVIAIVLMCTLMALLSSCEGKSKKLADGTDVRGKITALDENGTLNAENCISADRQYMYLHFGSNYKWYEAQFTFKDYLDNGEIPILQSVTDVFQSITKYDDGGADTEVTLIYHDAAGNYSTDTKHGFWIEDVVLNEQGIKLNLMQSFQRLTEANVIKPHSRHCTLRRPLGPKDCNPQYIFGNIHSTVFVDAVTGDVNTQNPAF